MQFTINGEPIDVTADIRTSVLDLLRNYAGLMRGLSARVLACLCSAAGVLRRDHTFQKIP